MLARWVPLYILALMLFVSACSSAQPSPLPPSLTATSIPSTPNGGVGQIKTTPATIEATIPALATVPPIPSFQPVATFTPLSLGTSAAPTPSTLSPLATLTPTHGANATTPRATTSALAPGVYVTAVRLLTDKPLSGQNIAFVATFLNTTEEPKQYTWRVLVWEPGGKNAKGDTPVQHVTVPVGASEFTVAGWIVSKLLNCQPYFAQANYLDENKSPIPFRSTNGSIVSFPFQVCPP